MTENKKLYVVPNTQVTYAEVCNVLAASSYAEISPERCNYLCPNVPETRCRKYNRYVRSKRGVLSLSSEVPARRRVSMRILEDCPYEKTCEIYKQYRELTNGKQR